MTVFFVVPVYNKQNLIEKVCRGLLSSVSLQTKSKFVFVIDGCTDNSESILREIKNDDIILIHTNDVHEIRSLNAGLNFIKNNLNPQGNDIVFTVQDDVIVQDTDIDLKFYNLFDNFPDLGYVSWRLGCNLSSLNYSPYLHESNFVESEFGHWSVHGLMQSNFLKLKHNNFIRTEIAIRSPTCVMWKQYDKVGFYNEELAPLGFDCHDISIRMNMAGLTNGVFALKYYSDVNWGSTREKADTPANKRISEYYERNRKHISVKYDNYFKAKQ